MGKQQGRGEPPEREGDKAADKKLRKEETPACPAGRKVPRRADREEGTEAAKESSGTTSVGWGGEEEGDCSMLNASLHFLTPFWSNQPHASSCTMYSALGWPRWCGRRLRHCASCGYGYAAGKGIAGCLALLVKQWIRIDVVEGSV